MNEIFTSFHKSLLSLFRPQIWLRILLPWMIAFALAIGILVLEWNSWFSSLFRIYENSRVISVMAWPFISFWAAAPEFLSKIMSGVTLLILFIVSFYVVSVFLISTIVVPLLVPLIAKSDYPHLQAQGKGLVLASLANSIWSFIKYAAGFICCLPFWLIPAAPFFSTVCWNGYLAGKIFPYDVLQDWASPEELKLILETTGQKQWTLGLLSSMLFVVPGVNFLAPTLMTLAFIHLNLSELQNLRKSRQSV